MPIDVMTPGGLSFSLTPDLVLLVGAMARLLWAAWRPDSEVGSVQFTAPLRAIQAKRGSRCCLGDARGAWEPPSPRARRQRRVGSSQPLSFKGA